ncbi:AraC family transcriptional regulator [Oceanobacillus sp. CFH 90083]|uniref:AraC family transcriptional regulator n=1 Tax=Oceanobacillus sp. CFH 90083 TaxID=2592336 RepID=UPI00128DE3A9|nr:AraC family transcriptional regulator [Oceanobacillus sp. CFH 90083]
MSEHINRKQNIIANIIERYSTQDGTHRTAIPSLFFTRLSKTSGPNYGTYNTSLCFIAQGVKEVLLVEDRFIYSPEDYLIASVDLPASVKVVEASPDIPYLALKIEFTPSDILEVLREFQMGSSKKKKAERGMYVNKIEAPLLDAISRLVHLLDTPEDIPILAPLITKEIIYRVLQGNHGESLRQLALEGSSTHQINHAIKHMMHNYTNAFKIEKLAEIANMSVSSFHRHFKEVTGMSPIQFQKQLRLQEARNLLLSESADAADVAFRVGYESPSQFSREYVRMFGLPPKEDIQRLKVT